MSKTYIGIDNGVSGSIGIINRHQIVFRKIPVKRCLNFHKTRVAYINRVDVKKLHMIFLKGLGTLANINESNKYLVVLERPFSNAMRYTSSVSAQRCLEAELIVIEEFGLPYQFIDSKEWQKALLPKGIKKSEKLKEASWQVGKRLFPKVNVDKHDDYDGLLIAEYARRNKL